MKSVTRSYRFSAAIVAAAVLAACSGGANGSIGGSGVTPSMQASGAAATASRPTLDAHKKKQQGKARIMIKIPLRKLTLRSLPFDTLKGHGHPKYISASTQSMTVAVAGVPTQTFNLTPTSPGCSTSGGSVSCSETAFFPTGQQTVTVTLYDGQNGTGNQLSTASTSVTIAANAVTNVSITLNGVPSTAKVLLNGSASDSIPQGTATSVPASVTAYDADNNIIMTPGNYSSPVTLANSDTSGATTLSTSSVSAPGASLTLTYNGATISSATITPSVNGTPQSSGAATLTLTAPVTPVITGTYAITTGGSNPSYITTGPDGALWFTESTGNNIGRITTSGTVTNEFPVLTSASTPYGITAGPDGALWFTEQVGNNIGRITTGGVVTEYSLPESRSYPYGITAGPDGALWFTEFFSIGTAGAGGRIGRITTNGVITEYTIPLAVSASGSTNGPNSIVTGPDGALWFTETCTGEIGRITTSGVLTQYMMGNDVYFPWGITVGSDNALWFTDESMGYIGRITTSGTVTRHTISGMFGNGITTGPDGAVWFTSKTSQGQIGRMTTNGTFTKSTGLAKNSYALGITVGPDGGFWFTATQPNLIGRAAP